ncbi:hypothetical protein ASE75_04735 [Sphingomonas sp. Leaf17]|uniref:glycosyltransferase n=1 Tax=Sphingomonas sp. Leaf17 TaxID=1735683 RepID=UPI0006F561F5|nr:glycosyltransferase [Sphingomonas sp. Leaf17]KQM65569.1 hypothetical protein ASE75_04735 [Sphingomonas sp. Leaf17]
MPSADPSPARHILTYARTLDGGGVERAQLRLARQWLALGRRVTLVVGNARGPLAADLPPGLAVIDLDMPDYAALLRRLPAIVATERPDIVFCAGNYYTGIALWLRLRSSLRRHAMVPPIVAKMSNAPDRGDHGRVAGAVHAGWLALHGSFLDHLVAMTPATATAATRATRMTGRVTVIPNPPAVPKADAPLPPLPAGRFILGVGRLAPQKRWDRLIAAFADLSTPDVALVILGDGDDRAAIVDQARRLGLADRVHLPGHAADPMPVMARAALLALTSDYEGVPGVLREALAMGTPVVTTDSSDSIPEIVTETALGSIVARDDHAGLVAALQQWLVSGAIRPAPVAQPGTDSAARYLALFDRLVADRQSR